MAEQFTVLWPVDDISISMLSPSAILKMQANSLSDTTSGLLVGEVVDLGVQGEFREVALDVIAPALSNYRARFVVARCREQRVYPAQVHGPNELDQPWSYATDKQANNQHDFESLLREKLRSSAGIALLSSLIAQSNEALQTSSVEVAA